MQLITISRETLTRTMVPREPVQPLQMNTYESNIYRKTLS